MFWEKIGGSAMDEAISIYIKELERRLSKERSRTEQFQHGWDKATELVLKELKQLQEIFGE